MSTDSTNDSSTPQINALHAAYLALRAVSLAVAVAASLRSLTKEEVAARLQRDSAPCGGLLVPYMNGDAAPYYVRVRLDPDAPPDAPRFLAPESDVRPYLPPTVANSVWSGTETIFFTEGPIKALALSEAGFPAVGLGGASAGGHDADRWRDHKELRLHPDLLQRINLKQRQVVIVFDAGRANNEAVAYGEAMLTIALQHAGAVVRTVALPLLDGGKDQGPDDCLAREGRQALQALVDAALPGDPLQRARAAAAMPRNERTDAMTALLADLPWVASIVLSPLGTVDAVAVELAKGGITKTTLKDCIKKFRRALGRRSDDAPSTRYLVKDGCTYQIVNTKEGPVLKELANFVGNIVEEITRDDGVETETLFRVQLTLPTGKVVQPKNVTASEFFEMRWPLQTGGVAAVISAGLGVKDCLREAIQLASANADRRTIFSHTGFRFVEGDWRYLHAGGSIGGGAFEVVLGSPFDRFALPTPSANPRDDVRLSLQFLRSGPIKVMGPIWAAVYLAPLSFIISPDFAVFLHAVTGEWKSSVAAVAQSHFGTFDRKSMPANWESTDNFLEQLLSLGKDVLLVIDDYAPQKSSLSQRELEKRAQRIIRAIGNRSGKGRMKADTTLRVARPPRGLALITGEDLPPGHSIMARLYVVDVKKAELNAPSFTEVQQRVGQLPNAMSAYIAWLLPQIPDLLTELPAALEQAKGRARQMNLGHDRVPEIVAHLSIGMDLGLQFATETGAITLAEADALREEAWAGFAAGAQDQGQRVAEEDPSAIVLGRLQTLITQGRVVLCGTDEPLDSVDRAHVLAIGWRDANYVYILPDAAREAVSRTMSSEGAAVPSVRMIGRALQHRQLLVEIDPGRQTKQIRLGGKPARVWKLAASTLGLDLEPDPAGRAVPPAGRSQP